METKFEDIYITELFDVKQSNNPRLDEYRFLLSTYPSTQWIDELTQLAYRYHREVQTNFIIVEFPSNQEFTQQHLDELKSLIQETNKHYRHSLEELEKRREELEEQTQQNKERRDNIKSNINKLKFNK